MPVELLAHSNPCGEFILHLVARGNAIIAELLRLSENIPNCFISAHGSQKSGKILPKLMPSKYSELISDFAYFQATDAFESKIQANTVRPLKINDIYYD